MEIIILPSDDDVQISEETRYLLDERITDHLKNPENVSDFDEFLEEMENDL